MKIEEDCPTKSYACTEKKRLVLVRKIVHLNDSSYTYTSIAVWKKNPYRKKSKHNLIYNNLIIILLSYIS